MYTDIRFSTPISQANVTMSAFNLFIVINSREKEVHIPTYSGTSKFNSSLANGINLYPGDIFKSADGMMWGLMFPDVFRYPAERNSIISAYAHFAAWATSGGSTNTDWYQSGSGYTNEDKIYQIPGDTPTVPTVTTANASQITSSSALSGGSVTSGGGATVSSRGVCWSTTTAPTLSDNTISLKPVKIEGIWWAPVNAGYSSAVKYGQEYLFTGVTNGPVKLDEGNDISKAGNFYTSSNDWCTVEQLSWSMKEQYNPCPSGWRVPTNPEMKDLLGSKSVWVKVNGGGVDNLAGRWVGPDSDKSRESSVFFPAAGYRDLKTGAMKSRNTYGAYWSDDVLKTSGRGFDFTSGFISIGDGLKAYGFSIRCVKAN